MANFLFEQHFRDYFKFLNTTEEVMLNCNIVCCQSISIDKICISFYYDNSCLDVENEKLKLDKEAIKGKLNERSWRIPCEIVIYRSIFHSRSAISDRDFAFVTTFEFKRPLNDVAEKLVQQ